MDKKELMATVETVFKRKFNHKPHLFFSPGRINFLGEHIDYNDGYVMPAAINNGICYAVSLNGTNQINIYSLDFDEMLTIRNADFQKREGWKNYVLSVLKEYEIAGKDISGFDCVFGGNIAGGAGISSSAAVEGGMAYAINALMEHGFNRKELALLCQRAEHNFPGVQCGIMDQYANMMGKKNQVVLLDCMEITHEYFPLQLEGFDIVLLNSNVHHSLASSEYNKRRSECEKGLDILKKGLNKTSFRQFQSSDAILPFKEEMGEKVYNRCRYVIDEIQRTQAGAQLLKLGDIEAFGKLMFATHEGLRDLYEVSCEELDFLVEEANKNEAVIGSRMMGGGFGGCTINIVRSEASEKLINDSSASYLSKFGRTPGVIRVSVEDGTAAIA